MADTIDIVARVTRPDGAHVNETVTGWRGDWTGTDVITFARKLRALIHLPTDAKWTWTLEAERDSDEYRFVVDCAGWTVRTNPVAIGKRVISTEPASWQGDPNWRG